MATYHHLICTNTECSFEINTGPYGHYALMSGDYYEFRCSRCKQIHDFSANEIAKLDYALTCPICNSDLYPWNVTDDKCPKCNSALEDTTAKVYHTHNRLHHRSQR